MLLKNAKARLITINGKFENGVRREAYQIKPGNNPAVEVPDNLCNSSFVKSLIADGSLVVLSATSDAVEVSAESFSGYDEMSKPDLVALCEAQGIEVGSRDTKIDLIEKLEAAE